MRLSFNSVRQKTYGEILVQHCKTLSTFYLDLFNEVQKTGIYPKHYLNKKDALRELQWLCEYWKIREFELQGNPAQNW